jgi:hypothetical protein
LDQQKKKSAEKKPSTKDGGLSVTGFVAQSSERHRALNPQLLQTVMDLFELASLLARLSSLGPEKR